MLSARKSQIRLVKVTKPEESRDYLKSEINKKNCSAVVQTKTFSIDEKIELMNSIQNELRSDEFNKIVEIIENNQPDVLQANSTSYEFDLQKLNDSTLAALECYIENYREKRFNLSTLNPVIGENEKKRSELKNCLNKNTKRSLLKQVQFAQKINRPSVSSEFNEHQCMATKKLRNKICYVCGLTSKSYNITDHLKRQYKVKFDLELKVDNFTPDTICGTCRSNLTSNQRNRKFQFSRPMIWRPASIHSNLLDDTDCYFCIVERNASFFKNKTRLNLPQTSNCSLPKFVQCSKSVIKKKLISDIPDKYIHNDQNNYVINEKNNVHTDQIINQYTNNKNSPSANEEETTCQLTSLENNTNRNTELMLKSLKEDLFFLGDKLHSKLEQIGQDLNSIKEQQQNITSSLNIFTSLIMLFSNLNNGSTSDQVDRY